ncbi:MAG: hypothetical protein HY514_02515 [Candidatus Aenigmarchaeota archaeon]|nr:hypothetical protein [Candidatus Aenigmarchaeota archaeon]
MTFEFEKGYYIQFVIRKSEHVEVCLVYAKPVMEGLFFSDNIGPIEKAFKLTTYDADALDTIYIVRLDPSIERYKGAVDFYQKRQPTTIIFPTGPMNLVFYYYAPLHENIFKEYIRRRRRDYKRAKSLASIREKDFYAYLNGLPETEEGQRLRVEAHKTYHEEIKRHMTPERPPLVMVERIGDVLDTMGISPETSSTIVMPPELLM